MVDLELRVCLLDYEPPTQEQLERAQSDNISIDQSIGSDSRADSRFRLIQTDEVHRLARQSESDPRFRMAGSMQQRFPVFLDVFPSFIHTLSNFVLFDVGAGLVVCALQFKN